MSKTTYAEKSTEREWYEQKSYTHECPNCHCPLRLKMNRPRYKRNKNGKWTLAEKPREENQPSIMIVKIESKVCENCSAEYIPQARSANKRRFCTLACCQEWHNRKQRSIEKSTKKNAGEWFAGGHSPMKSHSKHIIDTPQK